MNSAVRIKDIRHETRSIPNFNQSDQLSESKNRDLDFLEIDETQTHQDANDQGADPKSPNPNTASKVKANDPLPLIKTKHSLLPDMKFGWRPEVSISTPPIPLYFDFLEHPYEDFRYNDDIVYNGFRPKTSFVMHEEFSNKHNSYSFSFPNHHKISNFKYEGAFEKLLKFWSQEDERDFVGMNPSLISNPYRFDSKFESGNLDLVVKLYDK